MDLHEFEGRIVLVTGAGSGIGAAAAELLEAALDLFVEKGFAATRVDEVAARATVDRIREEGGKVRAHRLDVTKVEDVDQLIETVVHDLGALDVAVNNAGVLSPSHRLPTILGSQPTS